MRVELPLRPSARAAPPFGPSLFFLRLQAQVQEECMLRGADREANAIAWIGGCHPLEVCDLGLAQDGSECGSTLWPQLVVLETANEGAGKVYVKGR